jgi:hypothetical protein
MKSDSIQDSTRYIVSEFHRGDIFPGNMLEMSRNVYLESGAIIDGAIYGKELHLNGNNILVEKSVYCKSEIIINSTGDHENVSPIEFYSCVSTAKSIVNNENSSLIRFHSDIYANKINLQNVIIYGNVYADTVILDNSIVLGGVYCNDFTISNSVLFTFNANKVNIGESLHILSPIVISKNYIEVCHPVKAITFLSLFDYDTEVEAVDGFIVLDQDDVIKIEKDDDAGDSEGYYVLSISERILNSSEIIRNFKKNKEIINSLTLSSHMTEEGKRVVNKVKEEEIEKRLRECLHKDQKYHKLNQVKTYDELLKQILNN